MKALKIIFGPKIRMTQTKIGQFVLLLCFFLNNIKAQSRIQKLNILSKKTLIIVKFVFLNGKYITIQNYWASFLLFERFEEKKTELNFECTINIVQTGVNSSSLKECDQCQKILCRFTDSHKTFFLNCAKDNKLDR